MNERKFNGTLFSTLASGLKLYKIILQGGTGHGHPTLCGYAVSYVVFNGECYELDHKGDYVYAPQGLN